MAALARWWEEEGQVNYPQAKQLLILADAGGSNGCRPRSFKQQLQEELSDRSGFVVVVCHYPTGCSTWNPIEHRLFSQISLTWAGKPLHSFETMLKSLRGTATNRVDSESSVTARRVLRRGKLSQRLKCSSSTLNTLGSVPIGMLRFVLVSLPSPLLEWYRHNRK